MTLRLVEGDPDLVPLAAGQTPLRWQREAMLALRKHLRDHRNVLVSAATGTGKGTLIASLIVKAFRAGKRTLFLVHRDELIDDVMARAMEIDPRLSAGKVKGKQDEWAALAVFASVQTLRGKRLESVGRFDFVITDESHHATAKSYQTIYKRVREVNPNARHIGFTATPFRAAPKGKTRGIGDAFDILCYEYSLQDAISEGALCPIRCVQIETEIDLTGIDPDDEDAAERLVDTPERNDVVAERVIEAAAGKPALVFCVSIAHAQHVAEALITRGAKAEAVWGVDKGRATKIARFKAGQTQILTNKDLLTEGFDHRATEVVAIVRPTQSRGLYMQMVGRGTRRSPATGKTMGTVLDFVANSSTHDLASALDLSKKEHTQRIEIGAEVRHRRTAELCKGCVTALSPAGTWADVVWSGADLDPFDGGYPCDALVLLRAPITPSVLDIVPGVLGVNEFEVLLFGEGSQRVAWYTYDCSRGRVRVAKGETRKDGAEMSVIVLPHEGRWEAWTLRKWTDRSLGVPMPAESADRVADGAHDHVMSRATSAVENPQGFSRDWQREPATERQEAALKRWGLKRERLSRGEASMLLEVKIGMLRIDRARTNLGHAPPLTVVPG